MKRAIIILAAAAAIVACSKSEEAATLTTDEVVQFTSGISTRVSTSGTESVWEYADQIGITMTASSSDYILGVDNIPYNSSVASGETDDKTTFTAAVAADAITYPNSGTVSFRAYFPYSDNLSSGSVTIEDVDLSDQSTGVYSKPLMTAQGKVGEVTEISVDNSSAIELTFSHQMAKLSFSVEAKESVASLADLAVSISGHNAVKTYVYDTSAGTFATSGTATAGDIDMYVAVDGLTATIEAIIHTETATPKVTFTLDGRTFGTTIAETDFAAGNIYSYTMYVGNDYVDFDGDCTINDWESAGEPTYYPTEEVIEYDLVYNGTAYEINSAAGLFAFADLVNGKVNDTASVYWGDGTVQGFSEQSQEYRPYSISGTLTTNIDLSNEPWSPICATDSNYSYYYSGTFDGGGYSISGLSVDNATSSEAGLFGGVGSGGVVKNVGVSGSVSGSNGMCNAGGVVGYNYYGSVTNCYNTATVTASGGDNNYAGGVVGYNFGGSVTNCYNTAAVTASGGSSDNYAGGVVGYNWDGSVTNCYYNSSAAITGYTTYAGGTETAQSVMQSDDFMVTLNNNVTTGMCYWVRSDDVNSGYPTHDAGIYYSDSE